MPESKRVSRTDWAKVDATTDEDIARQIAEDPDAAPELTDEWFAAAEVWDGNKFLGHGRDFKNGRKVGRPRGSGTKELVSLRLDRAILGHFRTGGPGWQTRLNDALLAGIKQPVEASRRAAYDAGYAAAMQAIGAFAAPPAAAEKPVPKRRRVPARATASGRPQHGTNARLIVEVLKAMPSGTARPADIRKALQSGKGVLMAFTSIRGALQQLAAREEVTASDDGKTWRYVGA
jgi:uncharacterized protein (DUF4415 family)